jgi:hypothetical protein
MNNARLTHPGRRYYLSLLVSILALGGASDAAAKAPSEGANPLVHQAGLTPSDVKVNEFYGLSTDIQGDTLVVSAPAHTLSDGKSIGALYVFQRPAGKGWAEAVHVATLSGADGVQIGGGSISGDTIVAVAPSATVAKASDRGAVYVFVKPPDGWHDAHETAALTAFDGAAEDALGVFGASVSGDTIVATAPFHTVGANMRQGAAYVWQKPTGGWAEKPPETTELFAADGVAQDRLGAVAIDGGTIVAASQEHTVDGHAAQGEAYVWVKRPGGWEGGASDAKLIVPDGFTNDRLGTSLAISGDTVVAGAPQRRVAGRPNQGAAYIFTKPSTGWFKTQTPTAQLTASDGNEDDALGGHLDIAGGTVIAGVPGRSMLGSVNLGAAYVFHTQAGEWHDSNEVDTLASPNPQAGSAYGFAVALSAGEAVATAPLEQVGDRGKVGVAHVFAIPPAITLSNPADGASFAVGQDVRAAYSCAAAEGVAVAECHGTVADGAPIDTSSPGPQTFLVSAQDGNGVKADRSVTYSVAAPVVDPPPVMPGPKAPTIARLHESARVWREGRAAARVAAHRRPVGTTFSFVLDQRARVRLRFKGAKSIRRGARSGSITLTGHAGTNRIRFAGRLSRKRRLAPGRYVLTLDATNAAGQRSRPHILRFTIVR